MNKFSLFLLVIVACGVFADKWKTTLDGVLQDMINLHGFPGATGIVFDANKVYYRSAVGSFTYGIPPPYNNGKVPKMVPETIFDFASCTKIFATTNAVAYLYERGLIDINALVTKYLPDFGQEGKQSLTIRNLLLHNSGLPPDPLTSFASTEFACPETLKKSPQLSFSCSEKCYNGVMSSPLERKPNQKMVYSDINFMTLMYVVGGIVKDQKLVSPSEIRSDCPLNQGGWRQCYFEAFTRKLFKDVFHLNHTMYLPEKSTWPVIAPTENRTATDFRHRCLQGEVHDENCFSMGGVSGHAGLFSDIDDTMALMRAWLYPDQYANKAFSSKTVALFTKAANLSQSSRALGWDTNADSPDYGFQYSCGTLSHETFMHTGYTGPVVCADPKRQIGAIFLCNRVYPDRSQSGAYIDHRGDFFTAVQKLWDAQVR